MPQARVSGGARPTRRAAADDRERDNGGGFDGDADASAARLGGCSTEAKARQRTARTKDKASNRTGDGGWGAQQRSGLRPLVSGISHKALSLASSSESTERDRRPNRSRARCGNGLDVRGGT